ncbi:helix-turn-helix domain-containing protein [Alkalicoccus daliensis]|uniref:Protein RodZ, contains Xre-like HTH and DUF4115 domains n=1 Tax=Alkalicoccus daliensis TaxID=745820 RepID=A0A1H0A9C0_9BACI|nr:RodZ domain-containing protein [Alkalicoccus daliensis]SDN30017.1 protein RodZ, contains Xre-like HTH and DUF4115 domains [Alkalicoccus daliensis]
MSELGTRLQTARMEKGYSLEELQQITKIQKRYLEAIEEGDFSKMPGEFYSRAFVKSYSEAVGLDPNQIFAEHEAELPKPKKSEVQELPPRTSRNKSAPSGRKKSAFASLLPTILALFFIVAIVLAVWIFNQDDQTAVPGNNNNTADVGNNNEQQAGLNENSSFDNEGPEEPENEMNIGSDNADNNEENSVNDENNENNENETPENELEFTNEDGNRYTYTLSGAEEFEVELNFTGDSWILISNDEGDELHQQTHSSGDEISFDFSDESEVIFNMGSTRTATLLINGEELEYESDDHHQYIIIERDNF